VSSVAPFIVVVVAIALDRVVAAAAVEHIDAVATREQVARVVCRR